MVQRVAYLSPDSHFLRGEKFQKSGEKKWSENDHYSDNPRCIPLNDVSFSGDEGEILDELLSIAS